ncbi:pyrroline-5-carboxylate reductase [Massilibacteroides sp.]|uniref:pyrroline-5-carboxylate reductase n=1 Tax=Massilibacteroides sp. TaxID=2034766 RepID=UPI00262D65ED|nr:pyrroline-5-carboxylate reductase [Massilibacteroides sp.]MDD4514151.1 pyrroline-5-carboxylate reductase [Massilibacteroides sp.]
MKITIIGAGNIGLAIARGIAKGSHATSSDITCTVRTEDSYNRLIATDCEFNLLRDNIEAVRGADIIILAVKPWRIEEVLFQVRPSLDDKQIIVSVAAGITFEQLNSYLTRNMDYDSVSLPALFRVMPNTAIEVGSSMTFVSAFNTTEEQTNLVLDLFRELGNALLVEERLMGPGTALASSGIAFAMRYMRAAIEGGVELGFYPKEAQEIVVHTVKGAVDLLLTNRSNPETEIDKVTTPGGVTIKGLNEMELSGFTSSVIRGLKASK